MLTDRSFFQGDAAYLQQARAACALPVLRKDFIVDAYQVFGGARWGPIASCSSRPASTTRNSPTSRRRRWRSGWRCWSRCTTALSSTVRCGCARRPSGINNRNLRSFEVALETTLGLVDAIPADRLLVTESGILTRADVVRMRDAGVNAFLVGEAFMRAPDPGAALQALFGAGPP
ncbi:MAG: indole-3-glycerol-phosphate synthase [Ideonella sp.]|nr:indole-3-glycerol-phosphate synthase [Ideonella sp.]